MIIKDALLSKNIFSRPGDPLDRVQAIVVHYLGNAGQSAQGARNFWDGLKTQDAADKIKDRSASAHYIVGLDGVILRTVPEEEIAYHCGANAYTLAAQAYFGAYCIDPELSPNRVTIGVELCHPGWDGKPVDATRAAAIELICYLRDKYVLNPLRAIWRHWDIRGPKPDGTLCPKWYVDNPDEWSKLILDCTRRPQ